jgi:cyclopropane-fatty-acyl-phospholipid synthase
MWYNTWLEKDMIPDFLIRTGIRKFLRQRLRDEHQANAELQQKHFMKLVDELKNSPIAINTADANEQHYEVPTSFYQYCLGKNLKYSCGYWRDGVVDLNTSEEDMLQLTCERAELIDGQNVLELGCGWGSLSLFMAARYPGSRFTVVSNSRTQKIFIDEKAADLKLNNLTVVTADMNEFNTEQTFDRVVSVEMFEHMRNYQLLMKKVASWLSAGGKLFVHIFTHKTLAYKYEVVDESDWMSKYFFTGGIMPSDDLLLYFNEDLSIENHWQLDGIHYARTSEAWLKNMDQHKKEIMPLFAATYGAGNATKWWVYWRIFYMSCAELWNYRNGEEWIVSHYLFNRK